LRGKCKICRFFQEGAKRGIRPDRLSKLIGENKEPQVIQEHLRTLGLEVSRKTIKRHIQECTSQNIREQRNYEKSHKDLIKRLGKRAKNSFEETWQALFPKEGEEKKCPHTHTEPRMNLVTEEVCRFCLDCGEWVGVPYNPQETERESQREKELLWILKRKS